MQKSELRRYGLAGGALAINKAIEKENSISIINLEGWNSPGFKG